MRVSASAISNYIFVIDPRENIILNGALKTLVARGGVTTFAGYENAPRYVIKNKEYNIDGASVTSPVTKTCDSETAALFELGLTFSVIDGKIKPISEITEKPTHWIRAEAGEFRANHIPQLFAPLGGGVIVSIDGEYNIAKRMFFGQIGVR